MEHVGYKTCTCHRFVQKILRLSRSPGKFRQLQMELRHEHLNKGLRQESSNNNQTEWSHGSGERVAATHTRNVTVWIGFCPLLLLQNNDPISRHAASFQSFELFFYSNK